MDPGNPDLVELIRQRIRRDGPVTFASFMEEALYHPELGYYGSGGHRIGREGDYFTNVSVGSLFGEMLAAQFAEMWRGLGRPEDFTIVEQGADRGDFAGDVLRALREREPELFEAVRYFIVEPLAVLEAPQKETLAEFRNQVRWTKSLTALPEFSGVHFSNELLDAMPVHLVVRESDGAWRERFVAEAETGFQFVKRPITDSKLKERLPVLPDDGAGTYKTEINLAALEWLEELSAKLRRGFILAADFGFPRPQFFAPERSEGTLQIYSAHRSVTSPLEKVGDADIAAHVEWTSVAESAEGCGLTVVGFTDQHHFMTGLLSLNEPAEDQRRALQTLLHPEFLGTRFQYLALGRDVADVRLSGFRFARDARVALGIKSAP